MDFVVRDDVVAALADWEKRPNSFLRNIVYITQGSLFLKDVEKEKSLQDRIAAKESLGEWDKNIYWDTRGTEAVQIFQKDLAKRQTLGLDRHSIIADPEFVNIAEFDFSLKPGSSALKLGFEPIDMTQAGLCSPRPKISSSNNSSTDGMVFDRSEIALPPSTE